MPKLMEMWAVFESPAEYPGEFIVQRWLVQNSPLVHEITREAKPWARGTTIDEVRKSIPRYAANAGAWKTDEPNLVEVWI